MSPHTAVLQLHQREELERNLTRAVLAGAAAGIAAFAVRRLGGDLPAAYLALAGTSLVCLRGDRFDKGLLAVLSILLIGVPWALGLSTGWTVALAGSVAGALMVQSRICDKGEEGSVGAARPGPLNFALAALSGAALAVAGLQIARILGAQLSLHGAPGPLIAAISGSVLALFAAISTLSAHLALRPDPVEARCEALIPELSGELRTLASRALELYRLCGHSLGQLPRQPAREELARTLGRLTQDAVSLAADWSGVEAQLDQSTRSGLSEQAADLEKSAASAKDPLARRQLELAAASLREEQEGLDELGLRRERIIAKLKSEVALLERARVSLIGLRSGQAQLKSAELSALTRKFDALSTAQADAGKLADAVATQAELASHEASAATAATRLRE
jgi:hypothetical protein